MTATSVSRGHPCYYANGTWKYVDTNESIHIGIRKCKHCGELPTPEGHDACLGTIDGVTFACCGHGKRPIRIKRKTGNE